MHLERSRDAEGQFVRRRGRGVIGMWGGPMSPGSAYVLLHHRMGEAADVSGGWGFVHGGMGGVSEAIAGAARAAGADIETNAEVTAIDVTSGRAS